MLERLLDFFLNLTGVISSLIDFVVGFVQDIVYVVKLCGEFVLKIPDLFSWLPPPVVALIITIFAVVVIYKVIGREG